MQLQKSPQVDTRLFPPAGQGRGVIEGSFRGHGKGQWANPASPIVVTAPDTPPLSTPIATPWFTSWSNPTVLISVMNLSHFWPLKAPSKLLYLLLQAAPFHLSVWLASWWFMFWINCFHFCYDVLPLTASMKLRVSWVSFVHCYTVSRLGLAHDSYSSVNKTSRKVCLSLSLVTPFHPSVWAVSLYDLCLDSVYSISFDNTWSSPVNIALSMGVSYVNKQLFASPLNAPPSPCDKWTCHNATHSPMSKMDDQTCGQFTGTIGILMI